MTTATLFSVWLLFYMNPSTGAISLHGQFWTEHACLTELRARVLRNDDSTAPRYRCHQMIVPEPKAKP